MNTINKKNIEISRDNPFENCKLGREKIARSLTQIVKNVNVDNGFVISIDSPWGTGKTTFIDMWKALLEKEEENIICVKFNAWDNDFYNDPLISILENLDEAIDKDIEKITKNFAEDSWGNVKSNLKAKGKTLICDAIKAKTYGLIDISEEKKDDDLLKKHGNLKEKNRKIKNGLMELKKEFGESNKLRIVFFIDELDRCRPDYAIKVLEIIKHFFRTEGYVFILSLDKSQLSKSISTIYGQGMDSEGYLRRFIDVDYTLPMPSKEKYIETLLGKHSLDKSIVFVRRVCEILNVEENISLRDIEKLFFKLKIFLYSKTNISPERMDVEKTWIFDSIYAYFFVLNFLYFELYNDLFSENPKCFKTSLSNGGVPLENANLLELFKRTLKWFEFSKDYQTSDNIIGKELIKKIHNVLYLGDAKKNIEIVKYTNIMPGETINCLLDISLLFNEEGEIIVKNDIEMINGINN